MSTVTHKYTAASLADIAGMFDAKADAAHKVSLSRTISNTVRNGYRCEAHTWRVAAEILRNTTIKPDGGEIALAP